MPICSIVVTTLANVSIWITVSFGQSDRVRIQCCVDRLHIVGRPTDLSPSFQACLRRAVQPRGYHHSPSRNLAIASTTSYLLSTECGSFWNGYHVSDWSVSLHPSMRVPVGTTSNLTSLQRSLMDLQRSGETLQ